MKDVTALTGFALALGSADFNGDIHFIAGLVGVLLILAATFTGEIA